MASYRELIVWQRSMELVEEVYRISKKLPKEEIYSLSDQLRRAAVSIPSNIAEGQGRNSFKEFSRFIMIAQGSRAELETQLEICVRLGYLNREQTQPAIILCSEVGRMLRNLSRKLLSNN